MEINNKYKEGVMKKAISSRPKTILSALLLFCLVNSGCKKYLEIPLPVGTIIPSQVFTTDAQATAAVSGIYNNMANNFSTFTNSGMTIFAGMSADELELSNLGYGPIYTQFQLNTLQSNNQNVGTFIWQNAYTYIYQANSVIEGLSNYNGVSAPVKNELIGESEFVRAFCNFYLVNLFGSIPLVTTINYHKTASLSRTDKLVVYQAIITDLLDAQTRLAADYSAGNTQRIVPNKACATALLARVYLYSEDWKNAEIQSSSVLNNNLYHLADDLNGVFLINNQEAIWQLQAAPQNFGYATPEGTQIIPFDNSSQPFVNLTNSLMSSFDPGDQRKTKWIDSTQYAGSNYYYPYKYKIGPAQAYSISTYSEYYMVLRLAEQYLIRAEAEAHGAGGGVNAAAVDLNVIRHRAGLPDYSGALQQDPLLNAIAHENQMEFFAEWGHRWLDLKRTGKATTVLSADKGFTVSNNSLLYPIPFSEVGNDPNLTQNPGY